LNGRNRLTFFEFWWARQDLNLGPTDYESAALTAELQARTFRHITLKKVNAHAGPAEQRSGSSAAVVGKVRQAAGHVLYEKCCPKWIISSCGHDAGRLVAGSGANISRKPVQNRVMFGGGSLLLVRVLPVYC
jgi:hypothetical protein